MSLQWGRQQTYYPSAQPLSTGELALANRKLADAINSHLLGNMGSSSPKSSQGSELCNTPAEKMAEKVGHWGFVFDYFAFHENLALKHLKSTV